LHGQRVVVGDCQGLDVGHWIFGDRTGTKVKFVAAEFDERPLDCGVHADLLTRAAYDLQLYVELNIKHVIGENNYLHLAALAREDCALLREDGNQVVL